LTVAFSWNIPDSLPSHLDMKQATCCPEPARRDFFKKFLAGVIGTVITLVPFGAGLAVFLDPLRRKGAIGDKLRVTSLEALPDDGIPRKFAVLATRVDAWNKFTETPVGAVYLRRTPEGQIQAFNVVCPHAGCFVDFLPARNQYLCPCHNSAFNVTGTIADRSSPAARGLDSLEVEVRNAKEVWVKFQNFQAGRAEKVPTA
jgi:menaquinol-cytochrome c reductase iron-sulfur subunit